MRGCDVEHGGEEGENREIELKLEGKGKETSKKYRK